MDNWKKTRSGAWAGRGFHYQHQICTLLLVRQWADLAPHGNLIPEGFEDCVLEFRDHSVWIQIKSRKDAPFQEAEVQNFLNDVDRKSAKFKTGKKTRSVIILEQPRSRKDEAEIGMLFDAENLDVVHCKAPDDEILSLLSSRLDTAEVIIDGILSELYKLVADASAANASLPFAKRRKITTTEIERRITERLQAEDPSAIDAALLSGALGPVDFQTPVQEPDFYRGVKVRAGHVAANLVLDRPDDVLRVSEALSQRRHVLVTGPSGAGKSALVWLTANTLADKFRWFQINGTATSAQAGDIATFVRARHPSDAFPIGIVFDEVNSANTDLWDVLVRELRGLPAVYFLGSVRQEDVNIISNQSDTEFVPVSLGPDLAQTFWKILAAANQTAWSHWREPFELSEGLMLEYVHLLTQGRRLSAVIGDQIRLREKENRHIELNILRSAAVLCNHGGEVDAGRLFELLDIDLDTANRSLKRLIDEHLVQESRPGVLGGLHPLRSNALVEASHEGVVFQAVNTLSQSLPATTTETIPSVVHSVLSDAGGEDETKFLQNLAAVLSNSCDIETWTSILTGLGLATLERHVASFMSLLEQHAVQRSHWSTAAVFADPDLELPELSNSDQLAGIRNAISIFRALPKHDLRSSCLEQLTEATKPPQCDSVIQADRLLSCRAPICGGDSIGYFPMYEFPEGDLDIRHIAKLLSTAYLVDPDLAEGLVLSLGGESALFDLFRSQTPWVTTPEIVPNDIHGRTVRADWFQVAEQYQTDPHETVCGICETLIALSPRSVAAACDAVDPSGQPIAVGDYKPCSKNMPRANIPAKPRVAWNVAFRQILLARTATESLTFYTQHMAPLVHQTEKVFRSYTEQWIKGKRIKNTAAFITDVKGIIDAANALSYAFPEKLPSAMTEPGAAGTNDTLGALLTSVLGNLIGRLNKEEGLKAAASFAGSLRDQARRHRKSDIWRTMSSPPLTELKKLSERLGAVSCILHEMAHDSQSVAIKRIVDATRRAGKSGAVRKAARHCRRLADRRFQDTLFGLEMALGNQGWNVQCVVKPDGESDSDYWSPREIAILVEITDFETQYGHYIEETFPLCQQHLGNNWPYRVVPIMENQIQASLAMCLTSYGPMPYTEFGREWSHYLDKPIFSSVLVDGFDKAMSDCFQVSEIIMCRGLDDLHPEEVETLSKIQDSFEINYNIVANVAQRTGTDESAYACCFLEENWRKVINESEATSSNQVVSDPLCLIIHQALAGKESEPALELLAIRLQMIQAECSNIT